ncbi:MAG: chromate transporter, partial [Anaerotignaceae bacterium]
FQNYGVIGALFSTIGLVSPSVIVILIVAKFLSKFSQSKAVENVFTTLRPAVTGMLATVALSLIIAELFNLGVADFTKELFNLKHIILFGFLFILTNKYKKHPLFYIAISAVVGMLFAF